MANVDDKVSAPNNPAIAIIAAARGWFDDRTPA